MSKPTDDRVPRRPLAQPPGDYKPIDVANPTAGVLASARVVFLSWPAADVLEHQLEDRGR